MVRLRIFTHEVGGTFDLGEPICNKLQDLHPISPAHVPHVTNNGPALNELLDDGAHDDETVVGADHDIPENLSQSEHSVKITYKA